MPVKLSLDFEVERDAAQVNVALRAIENRARDARQAFERMSESFIRMERKQFASEGGYGSGRWAPLSPAYAARKRIEYPSTPILVATGTLRRSLTGGDGYISFIESDRAVFGSDVPYAGFHQSGTATMPARPPVPRTLPPAVRGAWVRAVRAHLLSQADTQVIE